jgi:hypothetical protein
MYQPLWMLVPWTVFAIAAGLKFWRITSLFRRQLKPAPTSIEQARHRLERLWKRDQQAA